MYGMAFVPVSHGQEYPHGSAERRLGFSRLSVAELPLQQKPDQTYRTCCSGHPHLPGLLFHQEDGRKLPKKNTLPPAM
jgi:hypothetical protein